MTARMTRPAPAGHGHTPHPLQTAVASALLPLGAMLLAGLPVDAAAQQSEKTTDKELATVKVEAGKDIPQDGYRATTTRVGKVLQDPHEIPQAVTTVTRTLMEEQQVGSLREALRNVSGLTFNAAEGGRAGDNMNLRGFYTFGDLYLDGIRDTAQYNRETFNLEQIDVLRGAGAMLFGRGQAGGVINQVSKTPRLADRHVITASVGTDQYQEITGDFNKHLGGSKALRVNVMKRDEGSWRENPATGTQPDIHRDGLAVSLGLGLAGDHEWIFSHVLTRTDDIPDYGVSFNGTPASGTEITRRPNTRFPASYFWGIGRNFDESETNVSTITYTRRFDHKTEWRTQLRYGDYERSYWAKTPNATNPPSADGTVGGNQTRAMDYETLTLQSDFNTRFNALGLKHEFLAGLEYLREDSFRHTLRNFGGTTPANPPDFRPYQINTTGTPVRFQGDSYALFAQDTVEFLPGWKATLGLRRDELDAEYSSATSPKLSYGEWSTRAALSWFPQEAQHYYLGFSDSFSPTADLYQLTVQPLPPERSRVIELGAKWLLLDGDLALRAALYRATKTWERNTDLEATAAILTRKRRTDGLELETAGRVNEHWEVFAGLALMDAKILEVAQNYSGGVLVSADPRYKGQKARNTPDYTFNLWTTYKWGPWKLGGGVETKGKRYAYVPSQTNANNFPILGGTSATAPASAFHPNTAPAYARWDALLAYEQKTWSLRLNIQNLFDELYYDAVYDNGGFTVPGQRRRFILTAEYKF